MSEENQNNNDILRKNTEEFHFVLANDVNLEQLQIALGVGPTHDAEGYDVTYSYFVPTRRHKKYRINKKWLKKYGVIQKFVTLKGCEINRNNDEVNFIYKGVNMDQTGG